MFLLTGVIRTVTVAIRWHSHGGMEDHGHDTEHARDFAQIKELIRSSALSPWVQEKAESVFHRIAVAEGKVHGLPPDEVHFHEVGAVDSIVDILGACIALESMEKTSGASFGCRRRDWVCSLRSR